MATTTTTTINSASRPRLPAVALALAALGLSCAAAVAAPIDVWRLEQRARGGDIAAQLRLGRLYQEGMRVELDYAHSAAWFRIAADTGDARGRFELGMKYFAGQGVKRGMKSDRS